ncbi:MAG: outer membrane lipoprotein-sorting protein [Phycisphaerae bacterium]|nr:outer membrane lipoprotein-sorting protein [Phycisphaerae bacterium]
MNLSTSGHKKYGLFRIATGFKSKGVLLISMIVMMSGCGCWRPQKPLPPIQSPIPLHQAIDIYNGNIQSIRSFTAKLSQWEIQLYDNDKKYHFREIGGKFFYTPPGENQQRAHLFLSALRPFGTAWVLGSNDKEYWMTIELNKSGLWGKYEHLGKPCASQVPIDPQYILEMVGLRQIPYQVDQPPYPVYKIYPDHYIIEYLEPSDNGLWLQREIIISRRTDRPEEINVYDPSGQRIGQSPIKKYKQLDKTWLPAEIELNYPTNKSFIRLKLSSFKFKDNIKPKLFTRPQNPPGIEDYQQIDKDCDNE